jgi:hypothetical protein
MKIKFDVLVSKQIEIDVPANWMPFAKAYFTSEEERTNEQWDLLENHTWGEMVEEFLAEGEEEYDTVIYSVEEGE